MSYSGDVNSMTVVEKVSLVYLALFGRITEGIGLDGYLPELKLPGKTFEVVAQEIFEQAQHSHPETVSSPTVTLYTIYQNLFAKVPEDMVDNPARAYWLDNWLVAAPPVNIGVVIVNMIATGFGTAPLTLGRNVMLNRLAALEYGIARQDEQNVSLAATRTVLQPGVTAADASLAAERAYLDQHTGAVVQGQVMDVGPVTGALVIADTNRNGRLDSGEASATTDSSGHYTLRNAQGPLIAIGGIDSTVPGTPAVLGRMSAPEYGAVISRLSAIQQSLIDATGPAAGPVSGKVDKTASTALIDANDALLTHVLGLLGPLEQLDDTPAELTGPILGTRTLAATQQIAITTVNAEVVDLMVGVAKILVRDADHAVSYDDALAIVTSALGARLAASATASVLPDLSSRTLLGGLLEDARAALVATAVAQGAGLGINTSLHGAAVIDILRDGAATYDSIGRAAQDGGDALHTAVDAEHKTIQDRIDALWNVSPVDPGPDPTPAPDPVPPPSQPSAPPPRTVTVAYVRSHQIASDLTNIATVTGTAADLETLTAPELGMLVTNSADATLADTDAGPNWVMSATFGDIVEDVFESDGKDRLDTTKIEVVRAATLADVTRFFADANIEKVDASAPAVGMSVAQFMTYIGKLGDNNAIVDTSAAINANLAFLTLNAARIRDGGIHASDANMVDNGSINLTQARLDALQNKLAPEDSLLITGDPASNRSYTFTNYAGANFGLISPDGSTTFDLSLATTAPVAQISALGTLSLPSFVSVAGGTGNDSITSGAGTDSIAMDTGGLNGSVHVRFLATALANGEDTISKFTPGLMSGGGDAFDFSRFFSAQGTAVNHLVASLGPTIPQVVENGDVLEATLATATVSTVQGLFSTAFLPPVTNYNNVVLVSDGTNAATLWYVSGSAGGVNAEQFATVALSGATSRIADLIGNNLGINNNLGASVTLNLAQLGALAASNTLNLLNAKYDVTLSDSVSNFNAADPNYTTWLTNVDHVDATGTSAAQPYEVTAAAATAIGNGRMTPANYIEVTTSSAADTVLMQAITNLDHIKLTLSSNDYVNSANPIDLDLARLNADLGSVSGSLVDTREEVTLRGISEQISTEVAATPSINFTHVDHIVADSLDPIVISNLRLNEIGVAKFPFASSAAITNVFDITGPNPNSTTTIAAFTGDVLVAESVDVTERYVIYSAPSIYSGDPNATPAIPATVRPIGFQWISTGDGNDAIYGSLDPVRITSGAGDDTVTAGVVTDIIQGGPGNDVIDLQVAARNASGGSNYWDYVVFEKDGVTNGTDSISGFSVATGAVARDRLVFKDFFWGVGNSGSEIKLIDLGPDPLAADPNIVSASSNAAFALPVLDPISNNAAHWILRFNTVNPTSGTAIAGLFGSGAAFAEPGAAAKYIVLAHDDSDPNGATSIWMIDSITTGTSTDVIYSATSPSDVTLVGTIHDAISLASWANGNFVSS